MRTILSTTAALLLTIVGTADAQELASSFDQLRVVVKSGDVLAVTGGDGHLFRGRLVSLSASTMDLIAADGTRRALGEEDVRTIRISRPDSLGNGAKTGFAVGGGLGLLAGLAFLHEFGGESFIVVAEVAALYGGLGAGIGVGIDALISSNDVIFFRPGGKATLRVAPILGRQARGMRLTLAF